MASVNVSLDNMNVLAKKVRYIRCNNNDYFIYSLNELDNDGYVKLYINKFVNNNEVYIDDDEWELLKNMIPNIVREIKDNTNISYEDLSFNNISNVDSDISRVFKLKSEIVELITLKEYEEIDSLDNQLDNLINENYNDKSLAKLDDFLNNSIDEDILIPKKPIKIEFNDEENKFYEAENEKLKEKINELEFEIENYRKIIGELKIILDKI